MRKIFGFMIGIVVGALVGSTIALLFAPESGESLRAELRARGMNFQAELRNAADVSREFSTGLPTAPQPGCAARRCRYPRCA